MAGRNKITTLSNDCFQRNISLEAQYGIYDIKAHGYIMDGDAYIFCEIYAKEPLEKAFYLKCRVYDEDDDFLRIDTASYGPYNRYEKITPKQFFDGFPCLVRIYNVKTFNFKRVVITPEEKK